MVDCFTSGLKDFTSQGKKKGHNFFEGVKNWVSWYVHALIQFEYQYDCEFMGNAWRYGHAILN